MKILVFCQYYYPEPFRITDICEELVKQGNAVSVVTGLPNYPTGVIPEEYLKGQRRHENINGVEVNRCYEHGRGKNSVNLLLSYLSYAFSSSIKALRLSSDYDIVLVNQLSPITIGLPAIVYKWKNKKKIVLYCLDLWPDSLLAGGIKESSLVYRAFMVISKWIYKTADKILITSKLFEKYFVDVLKLPTLDMVYLPQYAEDLFATVGTLAQKSQLNLVFAGNIGEMQSVETILYAANCLSDKEHILFHIVGGGSNEGHCRELAREMELKNVIFYGSRPIQEMTNYYEIADAMLVTLKENESISYTLPGKVQSYMMAGKPIIAAINGETRNTINAAQCGFCVSAEDYEALAMDILKFDGMCIDKRISMANNARHYYNTHFSKNMFFKKMKEELEGMVTANV